MIAIAAGAVFCGGYFTPKVAGRKYDIRHVANYLNIFA